MFCLLHRHLTELVNLRVGVRITSDSYPTARERLTARPLHLTSRAKIPGG